MWLIYKYMYWHVEIWQAVGRTERYGAHWRVFWQNQSKMGRTRGFDILNGAQWRGPWGALEGFIYRVRRNRGYWGASNAFGGAQCTLTSLYIFFFGHCGSLNIFFSKNRKIRHFNGFWSGFFLHRRVYWVFLHIPDVFDIDLWQIVLRKQLLKF